MKKQKKKSKKNYYFTNETQDKLILYQNEDSRKEREFLYVEHIQPAFEELVVNLISVYKYSVTNEDMNHLKNDCVTFLYETIGKWDASKGKKAFSYFNVVAKNWLTINTRKINKICRKSLSISDDENSMSLRDKEVFNGKFVVDSPDAHIMQQQRYDTILDMLNYIRNLMKEENDIRCIEAIIKLFREKDQLDFLNKRAIFVYLREISSLQSNELSSSLTTIRKIFKNITGSDKDFDIF